MVLVVRRPLGSLGPSRDYLLCKSISRETLNTSQEQIYYYFLFVCLNKQKKINCFVKNLLYKIHSTGIDSSLPIFSYMVVPPHPLSLCLLLSSLHTLPARIFHSLSPTTSLRILFFILFYFRYPLLFVPFCVYIFISCFSPHRLPFFVCPSDYSWFHSCSRQYWLLLTAPVKDTRLSHRWRERVLGYRGQEAILTREGSTRKLHIDFGL